MRRNSSDTISVSHLVGDLGAVGRGPGPLREQLIVSSLARRRGVQYYVDLEIVPILSLSQSEDSISWLTDVWPLGRVTKSSPPDEDDKHIYVFDVVLASLRQYNSWKLKTSHFKALAYFAAACCIKMAKSPWPQRTPIMSKLKTKMIIMIIMIIIIIIILISKLQKRHINLLQFKVTIHLFGIFS